MESQITKNPMTVTEQIINGKTLYFLQLDSLWTIPNIDVRNYKCREFDEIIRHHEADTYAYFGSSHSEGNIIVSALCRRYNKQAIIYYNNTHAHRLPECETLGAKLIHLHSGSYMFAKNEAHTHFMTQVAPKSKAHWIVVGTNKDEPIYQSVMQDAADMTFLKKQNIHINIGSGMTCFSLLAGWLDAGITPKSISGYETGMHIKYSERYFLLHEAQQKGIVFKSSRLPWNYVDKIEEGNLNQTYDAKVLRYLKTSDQFEDGDYFIVIGTI